MVLSPLRSQDISTPHSVKDVTVKKGSTSDDNIQKVVRITGVRFAYPLVQHWIDAFINENPDVQVIIESRSSTDPLSYDILVEAYEQPEEIRKNREYLHFARYAVLPVANDKSEFAKTYATKGIDRDLLIQLFFHDIFSDKEKQAKLKGSPTLYTRLQNAGAPIAFAKCFGYAQKDIRGKAIAGADEHLIKALQRDSTGVSYSPLPLIYDHTTTRPIKGIIVIPVDLNGNGRVSEDEKFYGELSGVIQHLEERQPEEINNVPVAYIHFSVDKENVPAEAIAFLRWVSSHGENDLHDFGYLKPEPRAREKEKNLLSVR